MENDTSVPKGNFLIVLRGVIFNPKTKQILIGRVENDPYVKELGWLFPGGRPSPDKELEQSLKEKIKLKTGLDVESLGTIFAKTYPETRNLLAIYYLCEPVGGEEKAGDDLVELKWVEPEELEEHFTTSFHPKLKEYILGLKS